MYRYEITHVEDWYVGAARAQLSLAIEAVAKGADPDSSPVVAHRVSAVLLAAAAFEALLMTMRDEVFDGEHGLMVHDHFKVADDAKKATDARDWISRLNLITMLWSPGNGYVLTPREKDPKGQRSFIKRLKTLQDLRGRLIHPKPILEGEGDPKSPYHASTTRRAKFTDKRALPSSLTDELTVSKVGEHIATVEEGIARLRSLADLPNWRHRAERLRSEGSPAMNWLLMGLDDEGGPPFPLSSDRERPYAQVRWCVPAKRYVLHRLAANRSDAERRLIAVDETRTCERATKCRVRKQCAWPSIRDAAPRRPKDD